MPGFINRLLERRRMEREGQLGTRKRRTESMLIAAVDRSSVMTLALVILLWALCVVLLTLPGKRNYPQLVVNQIAPNTIFSRTDFIYQNRAETEARKQEIARSQPWVFQKSSQRALKIEENAAALFKDLKQRNITEQPELSSGVYKLFDNIRDGQFKEYLQELLGDGIVSDSLTGSASEDTTVQIFDDANRYVDKKFSELISCSAVAEKLTRWVIQQAPTVQISEVDRQALHGLMLQRLLENQGNLIRDERRSEQQRAKALAAVTPAMHEYKKNDVIVRRNEPVTQQQLDALAKEREVFNTLSQDDNITEKIIRSAFWSALLLIFSAIYLKHIHPEITRSARSIAMIVMICAMSLGINYLSMETFYFFSGTLSIPPDLILYALPLALPAVLLTVILGYRVALYVGFFVAMVSALMLSGSFNVALEGFVLSALCGLVVRKSNNYRSFFLRTFFCVAATVWLMDFNWYWHIIQAPIHLVYSLLLALGNALFTAVAAMLLTFLFELIFNVSTNMSLMVLCDYNHPLLKELHLKAPGTSLHSQNVAVLAENAAMAIGANAVLARAGALFHDIGKIKNPEYFIENNQNGSNPHDKLNPRMSSMVISNHVKDGMDMALQYKLCRKVRQFIQQHHGTDLIKYFYYLAQNSNEQVLESDYRYPGPVPQNKEVVIVSLADACEAACRSLEKPTAGKIESMVKDIFRQRWRDGQLDGADLSIHELSQLCESFIHTLTTMYHSRIAYPKDDNNDEDNILFSERPASGTEPETSASGNA